MFPTSHDHLERACVKNGWVTLVLKLLKRPTLHVLNFIQEMVEDVRDILGMAVSCFGKEAEPSKSFAQVVLTFGLRSAFVSAFVANAMFHAVHEEEAANVRLRGIQTEAWKSYVSEVDCDRTWKISHPSGVSSSE